jgi:conjugal transfer pilus assembly protein TraW
MKKILLALPFLLTNLSFASDLGTFGETYEIREKSFLQQIQERLKDAEKSGKILEIQKTIQKQAEQNLNNPKPVADISNTEVERQWVYDPSISLDHDLKDQLGRIFYKAGTKVNPLEKISLTKSLIFIDGSDLKQVHWAIEQHNKKKGRAKIILVKGEIINLMRKKKVRLYFDQQGVLVKKFGIKHVPATLEQSGKMLLLKEVRI